MRPAATTTEQAKSAPISAAAQDIFVGRQPIYTADLGIYAYSLLFSATEADDNVQDVVGYQVTSRVILNAFAEIGLERLTGQHAVSLNITESFLAHMGALPITPKKLILGMPATMEVNENYISALMELKKNGIRLAINNYTQREELDPLLRMIDIVKLDVQQFNGKQLVKQIAKLKKYKIGLLAKNISSSEEYSLLKKYGFQYFQGYFLSKPSVVKSQALSPNRLSLMRLISKLNDPESEAEDIANLVSEDVTLSYKLLKIVNSAAFSLPKKIDSIHQATVLLGRKNLSSWASLIALSNMADRPSEILRIALIRAKACEHLGRKVGHSATDTFFTVGMFSALDILM
ncbi:MAG: HDOD domain-containing protein, partial [Gammaproteobacteria bacterium]|nr:HDOD domain-containing protein [Gammaproteobacteria bacterium]